MEKKTKQRMIGVFIVLAIIIGALPLFFNKTELATPVNVSASPASQDQAMQTPSSDPAIQLANSAPTASEVDVVTTQTDNTHQQKVEISEHSDATHQLIQPETTEPQPQAEPQTTSLQPAVQNQPTETPAPVTPIAAKKQTQAKAKPQSHALHKSTKSSSAKHSVSSTVVWAVQMGYFKNKNNARLLTDRLRTAGFKAFTRSVKIDNSERIRVYVGPEHKQASAAALSNKINQKLKLQGLVVLYKPYAL